MTEEKQEARSSRRRIARELKEAYRAACPQALAVLVEIAGNPNSKEADRIRAAEAILDRGCGKPVQAVENEGEGQMRVYFVGGDAVGP